MQSDLIAQLQTLEESHLAPAVRTDRTRLADLLHETFIEIGASGQIHTRDEILEHLKDEPPTTRTLENFRARPLAENIVLTTYTVTQPDRRSRRSSVWIREHDAWRLIHHQGTPF